MESFLAIEIMKDALKQHFPDRKMTIVEFPGIPIGTGTNRGHTATIHHSRKTFRDVMVSLFEGLVKAGFRKIMPITVHHGMIHAYMCDEAGAIVMKHHKKKDVRIISPNQVWVNKLMVDDPAEVFKGYAEKHGQDPMTEEELEALKEDHHAGIMEITLVKAINEKLVDPIYKTLPKHVDSMGDQLKGMLIGKYSSHPPCEPDGCGYNGSPAIADTRDWLEIYKSMLLDASMDMFEAMYSDDREKLKPYTYYGPWKHATEGNAGLEIARRLLLGANSMRNLCYIPVLVLAIVIPWLLYIMEKLK